MPAEPTPPWPTVWKVIQTGIIAGVLGLGGWIWHTADAAVYRIGVLEREKAVLEERLESIDSRLQSLEQGQNRIESLLLNRP